MTVDCGLSRAALPAPVLHSSGLVRSVGFALRARKPEHALMRQSMHRALISVAGS
jgi:hypothetical protein